MVKLCQRFIERRFEMWTPKMEKFDGLQTQVRTLICVVKGNDCMMCNGTSQENVDKIAHILRDLGIDPKDVEAEMLTIVDNFSFSEGWVKSGRSEECGLGIHTFFAVCYKLLK